MKKCGNNKKLLNVAVLFLVVNLFILSFYVRQQIVVSFFHATSIFYWAVNFGALFGLVLLLSANGIHNTLRFMPLCIIWIVPIIQMLVSTKELYPGSFLNWIFSAIMLVCTSFIPITLIYTRKIELSDDLIRAILFFLNGLMFILVIAALIDFFFDRALIRMLVQVLSFNPIFTNHAYGDGDWTRFCSYLGHPLFNMVLSNMLYALNVVAAKKQIKGHLPIWVSFAVTAIMVATCASKTGAVVFVGITFLAIIGNKWMLIVAVIGAGGAMALGMFDKLAGRFLSGPLTTGRSESLKVIIENPDYPLHLFYGYGNLQELYTVTNPAAFEYPFVNLSYCYGILYPIILLCVPLIYCIYRFVKMKEYIALLLWLGLFAEMNTFDSLGCHPLDYDFVFWFFTFLLLQIASKGIPVKKDDSVSK